MVECLQNPAPCTYAIGYRLRDRLSYVRESLKTPNNRSRKNVHFSPRLFNNWYMGGLWELPIKKALALPRA